MLRDRDSIDEVMATRETRTTSRGRTGRTLIAVALGIGSVFGSTLVHAEGKTAFLTDQLRKNTDYRVRLDAALKLGTSDDATAVKPLCQCLDDGSEVEAVRVACAAALGKLKKPGGDTCLKDHSSDKSSKVREQVQTSIKALGGSVAPAAASGSATWTCPPAPKDSKAKYFIGVAIENKTTRPDSDIKPLVEQGLSCKLTSFGRFKLAPDTDPKKMTASIAAQKEKLDGYYLAVRVEPIKYSGGNLNVSMKLTIMTHTRDLKGEVTKTLTQPGVSSPSKSDEDDLLKMAAEKLASQFADLKQ